MSETISYLSLCGLLGYGYPLENLERSLELVTDPAFIGVDAGSTDPGPYYLGNGTSFVKEDRVRRDLEPALIFAREHHIPLIIGTAGGSGAKPHVDALLETLAEISKEHSLEYKLAVINTDIESDFIRAEHSRNRISSCGNSPEFEADFIDGLRNPVAQVGTQPIVDALAADADVVICGRCCDTAIFAALPMLRGYDPALSLHSAKIAECGTLCATPGSAADSLVCTIGEDFFRVEPVNEIRTCTPESVAAHSLYEQPDPRRFVEPEGVVDLTNSVYTTDGSRGVRVTGTRFVPASTPTLKLEGSTLVGYRSLTIAGVCDPIFIESVDTIERIVGKSLGDAFPAFKEGNGYQLYIRTYGEQALKACFSRGIEVEDEMGIVMEVIGPDQETADTMLSFARSTTLHQSYPGRKTTAGNLAFPYSPSDISCGPVYEFSLYHLLTCDEDSPRFPARMFAVKNGELYAHL